MKRKFRSLLLVAVSLSASIYSFAIGSVVRTDTSLITKSLLGEVAAGPDKPGGNLLRFDATYGRNYFEIIWNTVSSSGCDHFDVERSYDGINFHVMGVVKGIGPCTRKDNFFFKDDIRPSTARKNDFYYRLKQVDMNGQSSYSKLLIARVYNTKSLSALTITPDPDMNDVLVNAQLKERSFVVMKLDDNAGNEIMRKTAFGENGFNTYRLDETSKLKPGTYSLEVIVNSRERMTMKLLKK
jgi:hypothetical protein